MQDTVMEQSFTYKPLAKVAMASNFMIFGTSHSEGKASIKHSQAVVKAE